MKVVIIYNKDMTGVINTFGMQNKEVYNPATVKMVATSLEKQGHNVHIIDGNINVVDQIQSFMPRVVEGEKPGMVFNMAYGIQGESRYTHIPSLLEMLGIPYIGSAPSGHAIALDKVITKIIMERDNIPTPRFWVFSGDKDDMSGVAFPVIVKPKMESVSFGLRVVENTEDLKEAVGFIISEFNQQALVEQFIPGREFCVGLLGNNPVEAFPVLEIDLEGDPNAIQTVDDKTQKPKRKICPANISDELAKKMTDLSIKAYKSLHLRDFARVDIRLDDNDNIYILEINSMASLGKTGSYVQAAEKSGYSFEQLVNRILDVATVRYFASEEESKGTPNSEASLKVKVRGFARSRQINIESLLEKITNIDTYVRNVHGVNEVGALIGKQFKMLGFNESIIPQAEIGNILFFSNTNSQDYDYLLLGHLDTSAKYNLQQSFSRNDLKIHGNGVWESKGGILTALLALQSLRYNRSLRKLKIGILLTTDNSLQSRVSKEVIIEKSIKAKTVIGLQGSSADTSMVTSRSGAAVFHCTLKMKDNLEAGDVALTASTFSGIIKTLSELSSESDGLVIAPSELRFRSNITEPHATGEMFISARYNSPEQLNKINTTIEKILKKNIRKKVHTIQIEGGERRPPLIKNQLSEDYWKQIKRLASELDIRILEEHRWSSADICFINKNQRFIDGFGPNGGSEGEGKEYIFKHSLIDKAILMAITLIQKPAGAS